MPTTIIIGSAACRRGSGYSTLSTTTASCHYRTAYSVFDLFDPDLPETDTFDSEWEIPNNTKARSLFLTMTDTHLCGEKGSAFASTFEPCSNTV